MVFYYKGCDSVFIGEEPIHIAAGADIAEIVVFPGDPLRAKYIAQNFLENATLVTNIRNMSGYTGMYKGKKVTVMGSGMGMPSASIYTFELIHYFNVKKIIRIGTCGAVNPNIEIGDILLSSKVYSESNFAYTYNNYPKYVVNANEFLNEILLKIAEAKNIKLHLGMLTTMDVFGPYIDYERVLKRIPKEYDILGEEMEAFGIIHVANSLGVEATCMATVVDSKYSKVVLTPEERETTLNDMITLALEAIIK